MIGGDFNGKINLVDVIIEKQKELQHLPNGFEVDTIIIRC